MASLTTSSSSSSLPLSSTDHQNHYTYEVFLSFRGEDTRFNFTDHLHTALCQRGIENFRDDGLRRGEEISSALLKAIEESRVSIIVFSQNYASSRWCLDELVKILDCRKSRGHEVRSIFYKVDPSDVRHQRGAFGEAFYALDQCKYKDSMDKWKAALKEAADLSGWPFKDGEYESKFIDKIVGELSAQVINPSCELQVAANPIGIESCRQDVNRLLHTEENIVRMVGIWGPGGIGKTTIAKDVFNSIHHKFAGSCFLADVRSNYLTQLQERLLFDILRDPALKVNSVDQGVSLIKTMMRHKKILLILDDVSHSNQLQNLIPCPNCFGPGSRILITTRDKRWLIAHQVDEVYEVKMLDYDQALVLFSLNAFKINGPPSDYLELARRAICYAQGLPLALIVLGSHLFRRSREEWEATLDSCREDPHREIRNVLKISYDALGVDLKGYFLDIACFFKGMHINHVKPILEACYDLKSVIGIKQLQEKALIRIDRDNEIWMHDLIEEMGKDIVYQESPGEPGERSRVWSKEDVDHVLTYNTGTNKIIGIQARVFWRSFKISLNAKSFSGMKNLRYISMSEMMEYEFFSGDIDYLSNQLRWLDWSKCPLQSFPSNFHANKLVNLDISESCGITRLWEGRKNFSRLTCMNLRGCDSITELPDFSGIPNLKELNLCECRNLVGVPDSVGFLPNLVILNVDRCFDLIMFPRKINWKYAETISIRSRKLEEFSKVGKEMSSLRILDISDTCIKELDESIGNLIGLEWLDLFNCKNLTTLPCSIYGLQNLKRFELTNCSKLVSFPTNTKILNVDGCSLSLPKLQIFDIGGCSLLSDCDFLMTLDCWETLKWLNLSRNNFVSLPACITKFVNLGWLDLRDCKRLREILELPPYVRPDISGCESLRRFSKLTNPGAVIEAESSLCSKTPKRHCTAEELSMEPTLVIPPKRQRTGQASMVHFAHEMVLLNPQSP
ncbi:putative TIR domain, P-loop containing nucleoside triphosphate hydrolase [Rosa chinensis]|uniref:Putative TIR domain, P-loop containing nucleoside triphosphate hydrolase n=1 Tax=Rosa chinensis TaxID=74649 RepID=A0A2P6QPL4_ROSCH|nr:disease resistance protein RUN1 [Rosa chinensis]XP_040373985.1 disease resistance protein RUN1 [Rosa chinensis]XP_040373986.1 disease resistance protein RUN1 [Rosa chinensis]XP_040373987.1 disease resistance protein RUN1 [Rosa chinensis]XP_040373988.1 disease resistance protein RUN1 [Rosa chinensis]PRQ36129.1 putative TIR domain, P-loop containing nucleoside triphosphate hydrolase [Rosa chinensis]